jgi:hypothetical protein
MVPILMYQIRSDAQAETIRNKKKMRKLQKIRGKKPTECHEIEPHLLKDSVIHEEDNSSL